MSSRLSRLRLRERIQRLFEDPEKAERERKEFAESKETLSRRKRRLDTREHNIRAAEAGIFKSDRWANLVIGDYNPDKIGVPTYKKMKKYDARVRAGLDILEMAITSVPWEIKHEDDDVQEFCKWTLERLRRPTFGRALSGVMTAHWAGYSVTETVWEYVPDQKRWSLRRELGLKTLDPETIKFFTAQTGQLLKVEQTISGQTVKLDTERMLLYPFNQEFGNWYGESLLQAAYKNWFIKDNMLKFANIAFERFGAPIMLGIARDIKSVDNVEDVLSHLYARSVGVLVKQDLKEDPTDIRILESKRASMPFMEYIDYHNRMILERMLIGEPLLKGGGGVYGPRIPYAVLKNRMEEIRRGISEAMSYLLDLLVEVNFDTTKPARIEFGPVDEEAVESRVESELDKDIELPGGRLT